MKKERAVIVSFRDPNWSFSDRPRGDFILWQLGWVVKDGKKWLTLASQWQQHGSGYREWTRIPQNAVVSIRRVYLKRDLKKERVGHGTRQL